MITFDNVTGSMANSSNWQRNVVHSFSNNIVLSPTSILQKKVCE